MTKDINLYGQRKICFSINELTTLGVVLENITAIKLLF